jgi:hypothetical protein
LHDVAPLSSPPQETQEGGAGAVAEHASGIVDTVAKIAKTIGIPLLHAAPYIAALI